VPKRLRLRPLTGEEEVALDRLERVMHLVGLRDGT
jgi:hypothetical protein